MIEEERLRKMIQNILNDFSMIKVGQTELYHYTTTNSLINIFNTGEFWLTRHDYLNDYLEFIYIKEIILEVLKEKGLIEKDNWNSIVNLVISSYHNIEQYVLSLSESSDSLALWSNYSSCEGYNIGINIHKLLKNLIDRGIHYSVHCKVIYQPDQQFDLMRKIIDKIENNISDELEKILIIIYCIIYAATFFKKYCFNEEKEYRVVFWNLNNELKVHYREKKNAIIPYIKIDIRDNAGKLPLESITIGPKNNIDIAESGLKYFLRNIGYENIRVRKSEISLRY